MPDKLNITELDFDTIKGNLIAYFQNVTDDKGLKPYKDYDFKGSALNTLMSILAYNTHYNAMTAHMAVNETFIDSAQLRSSVVSSAKLLGYVPRSMSSSTVEANIVITATSNSDNLPESLYLDRSTTFKTSSLYKTFYYTLRDGATFTRESGKSTYVPTASPLFLVEGQRVIKRYPINGSYDYEKYVIDDENINIDSLIVRIYPNSNSSNPVEYTRYQNISMTSAEAALYYIAENSLGKFEITFGNDIISRKPDALSILELEYVVTNGSQANGTNGQFSLVSTPFENNPQISYAFSITTNGPANGGSDRESIEEIRTNATSGFISQNRAVTADDYRNIILNQIGTIKSVSVWGGEDNDPPQYGKVFISPSKGALNEADDILTPSEKKRLIDVLSNKKVIAIIPEIVDAERINIVLDVLFKYNSNITTLTTSELENNLRVGTITDYNNAQLDGFGKIFRHSEFTKRIDNSESCILNSHVRVFLSKSLTIDPNSYGNVVAKYGRPLVVDDDRAVASYIITSPTQWVYNGVPIYLADKADLKSVDKRILYTYSTYENGTKYTVHENIGEIVLSSGLLTISPLGISDDEITIAIDLIPISDDIISNRNQIVKIDVNRCNILGHVDELAVGGSSRSINYQTFKRDR